MIGQFGAPVCNSRRRKTTTPQDEKKNSGMFIVSERGPKSTSSCLRKGMAPRG